ncbi:MAG: glycerophosphoryl diester phosphodiesterase membrane domain-containing protein [bacterium]
MVSIALRPRTASEIVDAAFQILRAHYAQFVMCSALAYLPWLVVQLLIASDPAIVTRVGIGMTFALAIGVWLVFALMSAVLIVCASQAYLGDPVDVGVAVRTAIPRLPTVLLGAIARYTCMFLGVLFFVVGAIYVGARLFAVTPVIVLEGAGIGQAFKRSSFLSEGRKWHVLNTLGLVAIIYWVIGIGVQIGALMLGSLMVQAIVTAIYTILVYPVIAITEALLYYDARIKSEGLDIQLMAGALDAAAPSEPAAG